MNKDKIRAIGSVDAGHGKWYSKYRKQRVLKTSGLFSGNGTVSVKNSSVLQELPDRCGCRMTKKQKNRQPKFGKGA